eukprot:121982-Hanusia_phi.AAC.1
MQTFHGPASLSGTGEKLVIPPPPPPPFFVSLLKPWQASAPGPSKPPGLPLAGGGVAESRAACRAARGSGSGRNGSH